MPELKLNFEYDGMYWHDKNNANVNSAVWTDAERDVWLKDQGWDIYRFQFYSNPTEKELVDLAESYTII